MKILYYDCFCGISGDMNLGALLDLGVDEGYLISELSKLGLDSEYEIRVGRDSRNGISGTKVDVVLKNTPEHGHRHLQDIREIIEGSSLSGPVKEKSMELFRKVAEAEAKVHGKPVEEVHFHEVGATDSIVDMVGAAIALDFLKADRILSSPVQLGGGFVKCAHGLIPVPAPATAELLGGVPVKTGIVPFETTTPTGAAILAVYADGFTPSPEFTVEKTGYGIGNRNLEIPNVLRVFLGDAGDGEETEEQLLLETNIDDMNPEFYGYAEERLFEAGALDVFKTPIVMKKGRPAVKLSVLAAVRDEKAVEEVLFRETSSIGLRKFRVEKVMLQRETRAVETKYGTVRVKISRFGNGETKYKAEYEDCRKAARENGVPLSEICREADRAMDRL